MVTDSPGSRQQGIILKGQLDGSAGMKVIAAKPDDLSLISRTHLREGKDQFQQAVL